MADVLFDITERPEVIRISRAVWIETVNGIRSIYVNYALFTQYPVSDEISERYAIVNLARSEVVSQRKLAQAFGCHYNTITRYLQAYDENSLEGLVRKTPGPKGPTTPWKITPPIREFIWELAADEPGLTQLAIVKKIEEKFQVTIHRAGVGRALSAYRQQQRQNRPEPIQLNIEQNSLAPITEKEDSPALPIEPEDAELLVTDLPTEEAELLISSSSTQAADALISQLIKGMDSRYGAALILNPFLQKLELIPILAQSMLAQKDAYTDKAGQVVSNLQELLNPERVYNLAQMFLTLVYLIVFRFPSIEAFKLADRKAFGPLIGALKAPVVKTLRRFLEGVTALETSGAVAMRLARQYLKLDIVQLGILYLDGHFIPYYGKSHIAKGYFTTRRLALKGNHHYFANDRKGRPIFFRITSAAVKFSDIIPDMVKDAQELMAETGTQSPLIVVFDRGGYDSKLFQKLDQIKWDQPISPELFTTVIYEESTQKGEDPKIKYYAYRRKIRVGQEKYEAEAKPGQERVALNLERKYLLDNIKIATYNLNEMLLDVFAGCYDDPKDIRQILQMIIERGAHLRLVDGTLHVTIHSMDLPNYQMAAEKLCRRLNELEPVTLDKNQFPIFYRIASKG